MGRLGVLDNLVFAETVQLVRGELEPDELLKRFAGWIGKEYDVSLVNFEFRRKRAHLPYMLTLIVAAEEDERKLFISRNFPDEGKFARIAEAFTRMALELNYAADYQLKGMRVWCKNFAQEVKAIAVEDAKAEAGGAIAAKFPAVWRFEAWSAVPVVFYQTDADVARFGQDGTSRAITQMYFEILTKFDRAGCIGPEDELLKFDSKENLDRNFRGELGRYFK